MQESHVQSCPWTRITPPDVIILEEGKYCLAAVSSVVNVLTRCGGYHFISPNWFPFPQMFVNVDKMNRAIVSTGLMGSL